MSTLRRFLPLLVACACAAAEAPDPAPATAPAPTASAALKAADALAEAGDARAAIAAYRAIVEGHRRDVAASAPALVALIGCYRKLRGDAAARVEYAELSARWLKSPPSLDDDAEPPRMRVEDDLLWKPWAADAAEPAFTVKVQQVTRTTVLTDGQRQETLLVALQLDFADDLPLEDGDQFGLDQVAAPNPAAPGPVFTAVAQQGDLVTSFDSAQPSVSQQGAQAAAMPPQPARATLWVTLAGVPPTVKRLTRLSGDVVLRQRRRHAVARAPLRPGTVFLAGEAQGSIESVSRRAGPIEVAFTLTRGVDEDAAATAPVPDDDAPPPPLAPEAAKALGVAAGAAPPWSFGFWLEDDRGLAFPATGGGGGGDGTTSQQRWTFPCGEGAPRTLALRIGQGWSTRTVHVEATDIELP